MDTTPSQPIEQVCDDLITLLSRVKAAAIELADAKGITHIQLFALYSIHKWGELAMGQVADVLHCDASNVTGLVDRMVNQGLLIREESPRDRRTKTLKLTEKGQRVIEELSQALPAKLGCSNLSVREQGEFRTILQKLGI